MKRGAILTLAKQAGMAGLATTVVCEIEELERFAEMVIAEEREACARLCDARSDDVMAHNRMVSAYVMGAECAAAIRMRSNAMYTHGEVYT